MLSLQRVFVVLWIVLVELPVFSFFIVVTGHLLLLTWLNSHFFLFPLSLSYILALPGFLLLYLIIDSWQFYWQRSFNVNYGACCRDLFLSRCGAPRYFVQRFNCFLTVVLMCPSTNLPTHAMYPAVCHVLDPLFFLHRVCPVMSSTQLPQAFN